MFIQRIKVGLIMEKVWFLGEAPMNLPDVARGQQMKINVSPSLQYTHNSI